MASPRNFENPDIIWHDIPPAFIQNLTPGRYILRKRNETDTRFYSVLTAVQEHSTGRGLQLFVNDLREFFFLDGPPTWESMITRMPPYIVHPGKQISKMLQCECLIHNVHLLNTVQMGKGNLRGDWKFEEKQVYKQMEAISKIILEEFDCYLIDQDGEASKELMGYFQVLDAVPRPKKDGKAVSLDELREKMKRKAQNDKKDGNENDKKRKTDEDAMDK